MNAPVFDELRRYVRFGADDEAALSRLAPHVSPEVGRIADVFYDRLTHHPGAASIFTGPEQVERLKGTLAQWLREAVNGPWDQAYAERRARIGRAHVKIALPQRYMFGAMSIVRRELLVITHRAFAGDADACATIIVAVDKLLDLELAMMLETYAESREELVRQIERGRANRMAALGTMAAGLAHEIRNPLNAALLQLQLMRRRIFRSPEADIEGGLGADDIVATELHRLAKMVEDFLQFARPHPLRLAPADLGQIVEAVRVLLSEEAMAAGVSLAVEVDGPLAALIDHERFKQVLLNLVHNAMDAAGRGGHVTMRASAVERGVCVEVEDDGHGIPNADAPIFEPFFTTKPHGTGLGLSIAHRIVADHGGRIEVASRPGRTVFSVFIPPDARAERSSNHA